ncbi:MAG: cation diffusion facilitator family transporter [Roseiflexaceae bacterium]
MQLRRYAWISLVVAIGVIFLKISAYVLTNSISLLSDALESIVNVLGATAAMWALAVAERPPDDEHAYGHDKAEFFSSGFEGALIMVAAFGISGSAIWRLFNPAELDVDIFGIGLAVLTSVINFALARWLFQAAKKHESIALEADAHHLMSDVITSIVVVLGVILVGITQWQWLDPLMAFVVGLNIIRMGWQLIRRSLDGLLDPAFTPEELDKVHQVLDAFATNDISFHAIRTRKSGIRRFVSLHVLVPGDWSVQRGHELSEEIESTLHAKFVNLHVLTHLEPNDDPASFIDIPLHRGKTVR